MVLVYHAGLGTTGCICNQHKHIHGLQKENDYDYDFIMVGGALENWSNFQTPQLLMKLWDLLDNMCAVVDLKFERKIPPGSASSRSKTC
jgi:hypothetical protein